MTDRVRSFGPGELVPTGRAAQRPDWVDRMTTSAGEVDPRWLSRYQPPADGGGSGSAVLMLFGLDEDGDEQVVLIERARTLRRHAGQIALPGGRIDPQDAGVASTAMREALEEVGLRPDGVQLRGELPALFLPRTGFVVTTFVGWWERPSPIGVVDVGEVARVITAPVAYLLDPQHRVTSVHPSGHRGAGFLLGAGLDPEAPSEELFLWGFTGGLVDRALTLAGRTRPWDTDREYEVPERFRD